MSFNSPILAILTMDKTQSLNKIIGNIRKKPDDFDVHDYENLKVYFHSIKTKYYETKIAMLPVDSIEYIAESVKKRIEGILIYFDAKDRTCLETLPFYKDFVNNRNIDFSLLICTQLMENKVDGVTFDCIKNIFNKFDVIELDRKSSDEGISFADPCGYDELKQALESFKIPLVGKNNDIDRYNDDIQVNEEGPEENMENELENFENLLTQVMQFRPNTENMSREDRLNCAQSFAEIFENLILQDTDITKK